MIPEAKSRWFTAWFERQAHQRLCASFGALHLAGRERLSQALAQGPVLVVSNHCAWWDPLVALVLTRRHVPADTGILAIGDLTINVPEHTVRRGTELLGLTPLEFDLLLALARHPRTAFSREVLLEQVWGYRHASDTRLVNVHVQRLRSKIEHDPEHPEIIVTVRGVGYRAGEPREP